MLIFYYRVKDDLRTKNRQKYRKAIVGELLRKMAQQGFLKIIWTFKTIDHLCQLEGINAFFFSSLTMKKMSFFFFGFFFSEQVAKVNFFLVLVHTDAKNEATDIGW